MLNFGGWQIEPDVLDIVPESIAREFLVLPLDNSEETLTLLTIDRGAEMPDLLSKLHFILNRDIVCQFADAETVRAAVDGFYDAGAAFVTRCQTRLPDTCSRRWLELTETSSPDERHCGDCDRLVHLCQNEDAAVRHAETGNCVALQPYDRYAYDPDSTLAEFGTGFFPPSPLSPELRKLAYELAFNYPEYRRSLGLPPLP